MKDVVIIGGGISGLSAAFFLKKKGSDILLLEKENRAGGVIHSILKDGYLLEEGPNTLMGYLEPVKEMMETVGLDKKRLFPGNSSKKRYIYKEQKLRAVPLNPLKFLTSSLLSWPGKMRIFKEPFIPEGKGEETIFQFSSRRFGKEATQYFIDPFVSGIYAGNIHALDVKATFPKWVEWERTYGSVFKGFLKSRFGFLRHPETKVRMPLKKDHRLYSFEEGIETLPKILEQWLGNIIMTKSLVKNIEKKKNCFCLYIEGQGELQTKSLILTTPAYITALLLQKIDTDLAQELLPISYCSLTVFHLGYSPTQINHSLDGFGFLVPSFEGKKILGVLWNSSLFPNRAPQNHVLLTVMAKGDSSFEEVKREVEGILSIQESPVFVHEKRVIKAIPQYSLGHLQRKERILNCLSRHSDLFLSGNYLDGVSVISCIEAGKKIADQASVSLSTVKE